MRLIDSDKLCDDLLNRWNIADIREEKLIKQVMADIVTPIVVGQPSVQLVRCKDCSKRYDDECPMRHVEWIEYDDDGWLDETDVVYDNTDDNGYCHKGKLRDDSE